MIDVDVKVPKTLERTIGQVSHNFDDAVPSLQEVPISLSLLLKIFGVDDRIPPQPKILKNLKSEYLSELISPHLQELRNFWSYLTLVYKNNGGGYPIMYFRK